MGCGGFRLKKNLGKGLLGACNLEQRLYAGTVDDGQVILGGGNSPVCCRMLGSISGQSPHCLPVVSPSCDSPKSLWTLINVPEVAKCPQLKTTEIY